MRPAGLYVHVPLCGRKCPYCSFFSVEYDPILADELANSIATEMAMRVEGLPIRTVYAGGGTPTLLPPEFWRELLNTLREAADTDAPDELTIETNPGVLSPGALEGFREAGFNRLSIGVQSFSNGDLQTLGRLHDADQAVATIVSARKAGFRNVCIDLIYGIPGQDSVSWLGNLRRAVELAPEHISCYELTLDPGTPMHGAASRGETAKPSEDECREMYFTAHRLLTDAGYLHYEVSNYARGEGSVSRHNSSYWDGSPYIGLGPSAHSFDGECLRSWNTQDITGYNAAIRRGELPVEGRETLTGEDVAAEMLMLGLRCRNGVDVDRFRELAGRDVDPDHLEKMIEAGRAVLEGSHIRPTPLGMLYADGDALHLLG